MGAGQASTSDPGHPPGAWPIARDLFRSARRPIDRFLQIEASSGIVLMLIAMTALVWANSPWSETYKRLLEMPIEIRVGSFVFAQNLHFVVNEVLMTLFFFVVGLEIRREVQHGELSELRRAALRSRPRPAE
jgi:NhaA family Na+:H+ antiporter